MSDHAGRIGHGQRKTWTIEDLKEEWKIYRQMALSATAPAWQVEECERIFFAGAMMMHKCMGDWADRDRYTDTKELTARAMQFNRDLRAYMEVLVQKALSKREARNE